MKQSPTKNFPKSTINFLKQLEKNNNREWFEAHRKEYEENLLTPAEDFVLSMGEKLTKIGPEIIAIPKTDKSIFRLHRDVRFSKNKLPYKSNLGMFFWEGERKKMECPGFYVHIEPNLIFVGSGVYEFSKETLDIYRNAVDDPVKGKALDSVVKKILKSGKYTLGMKKYKKIPKDFDPEAPYAEYLLYNGLYFSYETKNVKEVLNIDFVDFAFKICKDLLPFHKWLVDILE